MAASASGSPRCGPTAVSSGSTSAPRASHPSGWARRSASRRMRCGPLLDFERGGPPSRRFHADGQHVIFPFNCVSGGEPARGRGRPRLEAIDLNVLVHGDYLLTVHRERVSLPAQLPGYSAEGRSEQYIVYAVLDAMVGTAFDALNDTELALEGLQIDWPATWATPGCGWERCGRSACG